MSKYNIYCVDVNGDSSEFELRCKKDGVVVERQTEYSFDDVLLECGDFFTKVCEKYQPDTRFDELTVELNHRF